MSKVRALYHIVFCTKSRQKTLPLAHIEDLYRFIWKEIQNKNCYLLRIGGIENHVHILLDLHPTVSLSSLVQAIKGHSSIWMKSDSRFSTFQGWSSEYYAATLSSDRQHAVIEYIKNQRQHHSASDFEEELKEMYRFANPPFHEKDMM